MSSCTGNCFTTEHYMHVIKHIISSHDISEVDAVEDELRKLAKWTREGKHCQRCCDRSSQCVWFAYERLRDF
jgi:hypothetical protein